MRTQANGIGNYRRTKNPNGAGLSAEQMARIAAAHAEALRRRAAERDLEEAAARGRDFEEGAAK